MPEVDYTKADWDKITRGRGLVYSNSRYNAGLSTLESVLLDLMYWAEFDGVSVPFAAALEKATKEFNEKMTS